MGNIAEKILLEQKKAFDGQENLDDAKRLLANDTSNDLEILKQLGLKNHELDSKLKSVGEFIKVANHQDQFGMCVTQKVIDDIAYQYDLRLAKPKRYKYSVPLTITSEIKKWSENTGINIMDSDDFYILAPTESFDENLDINDEKLPCKGRDPVLVYKISDRDITTRNRNEHLYSLITEWGSNMNFFRKFRAKMYNNAKTSVVLLISTILMMNGFLTYLFTNALTSGFIGNTWFTITWTILSVIASFWILLIIYSALDPFNVKRKDFDILNLDRFYDKIKFFKKPYFDSERAKPTSLFTNIYTVFTILFVVFGILFWATMCVSDSGSSTSFVNDLGISGWFAGIPLALSLINIGYGTLLNYFSTD